jgi:hypothetical protein
VKQTQDGWVVLITRKNGTHYFASGEDCTVRVFCRTHRAAALRYADEVAFNMVTPRRRIKVVRVTSTVEVQPW